MAPVVDFFYDISSPYSYLASTQIEAIVADCGAEVVFRPLLLGGLFKSIGNQAPAFLEPRGKYLFTDLARWATYYGVPFSFPSVFPANTVTAMRALVAMAPEDRPGPTHALFRAYWAEGRDPKDPALLEHVFGAEALARASDPEVKQALVDATAEAEARGAFGAPTFFVGDAMYFGNDRLPFLEQHLRSLG